MTGTVYTETTIHSAPGAFAAEAPYQLIIVSLDDGARVTGRVAEGRVVIGDRVRSVKTLDGVPFFTKST